MDDEEVLQKTLASPWLRNDELEVSRYLSRYAAAARTSATVVAAAEQSQQ